MTKKKDRDNPDEPGWRERRGGTGGHTPPRDGLSHSSRNKCPNNHSANTEGKCLTGDCFYYVRAGQ